MEKNHVLTQSLTHPAYLMTWEPKLALWKKHYDNINMKCG